MVGLLSIVVAGTAGPLAAAAGQTVYRCVGSDGRVSLQDRPCQNAEETGRRWVRSEPDSLPPPRPAESAASEQAVEPPPRRVEISDPPPLWRCVDLDGRERLAEQDQRRGRWVPAWVVGADPRAPPQLFGEVGRRPPPPPQRQPGLPAGASLSLPGPMVYVEDRCWPLTGAAACSGWRQLRDQAERAALHAGGGERAPLHAERDRIHQLLARSCR